MDAIAMVVVPLVLLVVGIQIGYELGKGKGRRTEREAQQRERQDPGFVLRCLRERGNMPDPALWAEVDRQRDLYRRLREASERGADCTALLRELIDTSGGVVPTGSYRVDGVVGGPHPIRGEGA